MTALRRLRATSRMGFFPPHVAQKIFNLRSYGARAAAAETIEALAVPRYYFGVRRIESCSRLASNEIIERHPAFFWRRGESRCSSSQALHVLLEKQGLDRCLAADATHVSCDPQVCVRLTLPRLAQFSGNRRNPDAINQCIAPIWCKPVAALDMNRELKSSETVGKCTGLCLWIGSRGCLRTGLDGYGLAEL